ncbi:MAG: internal scaffolding protein [Microvirus sp.]|nr:MAG: internal scaffolding protein [Microvirus sp.]
MANELPAVRPTQPWDIDCSKDVRITKQEFADDCNINKIVARCLKTGDWSPIAFKQALARFADVSNIGDYWSMREKVELADEAFFALPADVRARFSNDAGELLKFVADDKNYDEAVKLGIVPAPEPAKEVAGAAQAEVPPVTNTK